MARPTLYLLELPSYPIYQQLQIEEALLRTDNRNWCLLNTGTPPAVIMGISGKVEELIDLEKLPSSIPVIRRFSGGGTVIVDHDTLFVSFILQKNLHSFPLYPESILRWSEALYQQVLSIPDFHLKENDYAIGQQKCGGNAQYIRKHCFVHHTTFLWDYQKNQMEILLYPKKTPSYRRGRSHEEFLCCLKEHLPAKNTFFHLLKSRLAERYSLETPSLEEVQGVLDRSYRKTTTVVPLSDRIKLAPPFFSS